MLWDGFRVAVIVLGPKEGSLCPMAPLNHSWEKPFPAPLESSCHRREGEKGPLWLSGVWSEGCSKNLSEFCDKSKEMYFWQAGVVLRAASGTNCNNHLTKSSKLNFRLKKNLMEIKLIIHALKAKQIRLLEKHFAKRKSQPHISKLGVFDTLVQWSCKTFRSQRNSLFSDFISCFTPILSTQRCSGI